MNYYEELGLSTSASTGEIRQAYKSLARLLHPDRQSDAHLRRMADLQMTRLNHILAVLTDPVKRERYDIELDAGITRVGRIVENRSHLAADANLNYFGRGRFRPSAGAIVWSGILIVTAVGFAFLFLYFEHDSGIGVYRTTADAGRQTTSPSQRSVGTTAGASTGAITLPVDPPKGADALSRSVQRNEEPPVQPEVSLRQVAEPAAPKPAQMSNTLQHSKLAPLQRTASHPDVTQLATPFTTPAPVAAAKPVETPRDPLIGMWLYVKPNAEGNNKKFAYRPEYIEMVIKTGEEGKVVGRYKGQFHVPDQPISSEVAFQFEGPASQGTNVFAWRGDDGASGQIQMKMISDGVIEVSWYTTRFGNAQKLAAGTAVLYRD